MSYQEMSRSRLQAYAAQAGIKTGDAGMPAYSTAGTLRKTLEQMGDQEYMITVEIGGQEKTADQILNLTICENCTTSLIRIAAT